MKIYSEEEIIEFKEELSDITNWLEDNFTIRWSISEIYEKNEERAYELYNIINDL
jgi:hypothetical protein